MLSFLNRNLPIKRNENLNATFAIDELFGNGMASMAIVVSFDTILLGIRKNS